MKKILLSLTLILTLASCGSGRLVKRSDICVSNAVETKVWFCNTEQGRTVYQTWQTGVYGTRAQVFLVDSTEFAALIKNQCK